MRVEELLQRPGCWLSRRRMAGNGVAVSCRVRLARNLARERFPDWASDSHREKLLDKLSGAVMQGDAIDSPTFMKIGDLSSVDLLVLQERHLISAELAERKAGGGVVVSGDERVAVMINEEDHLRIQATRPGMDMRSLWRVVNTLDSQIDARLEYAFSPDLGYLTACPSNVGTGLRASVMLHLLGLRLTNELDAVLKALDRLGLAVRGIWGEGSDAAGFLFQVSNQETLGQAEIDIISELSDIVAELSRQEHNARLRLMQKSPWLVKDCVARALAILRHACVLYSHEAIDYLCALRMGLELGLVSGLSVATINRLILISQPGHLQKQAGREMEPEERDLDRSELLRESMSNVALLY